MLNVRKHPSLCDQEVLNILLLLGVTKGPYPLGDLCSDSSGSSADSSADPIGYDSAIGQLTDHYLAIRIGRLFSFLFELMHAFLYQIPE